MVLDEPGHLLVALDPAEGSFGVEHAGRGPAQHHLSVAPAGDVAVGGPCDGDHDLDGVAGGEGFREAAIDAETGDGEHLLESFAQRRGRTGVVLIQLCSKVFGVAQPGVGVGMTERAGLSLAAALAITPDSKSQPAIGRAGSHLPTLGTSGACLITPARGFSVGSGYSELL